MKTLALFLISFAVCIVVIGVNISSDNYDREKADSIGKAKNHHDDSVWMADFDRRCKDAVDRSHRITNIAISRDTFYIAYMTEKALYEATGHESHRRRANRLSDSANKYIHLFNDQVKP